MVVSSYDIANRFIGLKEDFNNNDNPAIIWMLKLCDKNVQHDETPWCSAFVNAVHYLLGLPRTGSLAARSWLKIGDFIDLIDARRSDVVILQRGNGIQPGPEILFAPGHVGFFHSRDDKNVIILGGNQGNQVSLAPFPIHRILGIRRFDK